MNEYKQFLKVNHLRQVDLAKYLGITESAVSNIVNGRARPSEENLIKILENDCGWDVSMIRESSGGTGHYQSVVNSKNFRYDCGISAEQLLEVVKENQRQMGELIDTLSVLTKKIK